MPKSFKELIEESRSKDLGSKKQSEEKVEKEEKTDTVTTKSDYDMFEVMSALQKMIRRGKEAEAMYWAFELESFNPTVIWKRLMIMSTEDVGIADPSIPILIKTLWDTYDKMKDIGKNKTPESHILGMAVLSLCRANKNHEAMYLPMTVNWWRKYLDWKIDIPDVALDVHTRRGKKMGRGRNHWYSEGFRVNNKQVIDYNKWETAFRIGDEIKYNLQEADDYYFHDHDGQYELTEEDDVIDENGLPTIGTYDKDKL